MLFDQNGDSDCDDVFRFTTVCAICDDGGQLIICEGKCKRSFHATIEDGEDSSCESLGLTIEQIRQEHFFCKNCQYKQHQCFACGELGSSDKSSGPEVLCCVNEACRYFYHPSCVAKLLHPGDERAAEHYQKKIAAGELFSCPAHRCDFCKGVEEKSTQTMQFAVCRRCPRAYHRQCLPRAIAYNFDPQHGIQQRAWEYLIPGRVMIYCLDHEIDPDLMTPVRDHIRFPGPEHMLEGVSSAFSRVNIL